MAKRGLSRRTFVAQLLLGAAFIAFGNLLPAGPARAARRKSKGKGKGGQSSSATPSEEGKNLKPGQFTWHPERSPSGPVAIIVSVPKQRAYVHRNGILIGVSTCSAGKKGFETPTGVFTILEKAKEHASSGSTMRRCPIWSG
jgi:hypothetical protein